MRLRPVWFQVLLIAVLVIGCAVHVRCQELPDHPKLITRQFLASEGLHWGASALDYWSTARNLDAGCVERGMYWGAHPSRSELVKPLIIENLVVTGLGLLVRWKAPHTKAFWILPAITAGLHTGVGTGNNLAVHSKCHH